MFNKIVYYYNLFIVEINKFISRKEYHHNNKHMQKKKEVIYSNIKNKLNTKIYLHSESIVHYVNTLIYINELLLYSKPTTLFKILNYSTYNKTEYTLYNFVYIHENNNVVFVGDTFINNLLENSNSIYEKLSKCLNEQEYEYKEQNNNLLRYFLEDIQNIIKVFSAL